MHRRMPRQSDAEAGFTLIEVLIAMVILAVGLLSVAVAQLTAIKMSTKSHAQSQAMYVAERKLDEHLARNRTDPWFAIGVTDFPDPAGPLDIDPTDNDNTTYSVMWSVEPDQPQFGLTRVTVKVDWDSPNGSVQQINLQGIKVR